MKVAGRWKVREAAWAMALAAFCLFLLWGSSREAVLAGVPLAADDREEYSVLALQEQDGLVWLACGGEETALLFLLDAATGDILVQREVETRVGWAAFRGGVLFLREDTSENFVLVCCEPATLEETSRRELDWDPEALILFDCDSSGTAFSVLSGSRDTLRASPPAGEETAEILPGNVEFLGAEDSVLYFWSDSTMYREQAGQTVSAACPCMPRQLLGNGLYLDQDGTVRLFEAAGIQPLFQSAQLLYSGSFCCLDRENCLIVSNTAGDVTQYASDGTAGETCRLDGSALGLCPSGGVYRKERTLYYAAFPFYAAEASPTPSPSPSTVPVPEGDFQTEGSWILAPAGSTVKQLQEMFQPQALEIRNHMGRLASTSARLATGMTAGEWVIVVLGDCDGSGSVTSADLRRAIALSLEPASETTPESRAVDLDGDGTIGSRDLLTLSAMIKS